MRNINLQGSLSTIQLFFKLAISIVLLIGFGIGKADVPPEVQAVFVDNGCLACHGNSGNLSLADAATSEAQLVDINATCNANMKRVIAGDPANSVLYNKITMANPGCGGVMPPSGNLISTADQNTIYNWIISIGPAAQFGLIEMQSTAETVQETDPSVTLMVNRLLGTQGEVSVDYLVSTVGADTAISPEDYIADSGTLVFAAGENTREIIVALADDDVFEGSEVFSVTLSNVVNGAVLGSQTQTKITIADNEFANEPGTFFFNRVNYSAAENDGTLDITILRSFGAAGDVTVELISLDGTAVAGMDYNAFTQVLSFAQAERSKVITIDLIDDQDIEGDESFSLRLSNPTNGALLGAPSTVSVNLSDDESAGSGGGAGGGSGGSGGSGGGTGGGETTEPEQEAEYEVAGSIYFMLPMILLCAILRKKILLRTKRK